jgi:hypothetical protein
MQTRLIYTPGVAELYGKEDLFYFVTRTNEIMHKYPSVKLVEFTDDPYKIEGLGETGLVYTVKEKKMPNPVWVTKDRHVDEDVITILLPEDIFKVLLPEDFFTVLLPGEY